MIWTVFSDDEEHFKPNEEDTRSPSALTLRTRKAEKHIKKSLSVLNKRKELLDVRRAR